MPSITPVPTTRSSDVLLMQRFMAQMQYDQLELLRVENQLSTGRRISRPSEDAPAALRAIQLQNLLERKSQVQVNLNTGKSYLSATDVALSNVSSLVADVRGTALSVAGTIASGSAREAVALEIQQAIQQLADVGNQQFRGRYLFAGSATGEEPFVVGDEDVLYRGDDRQLSSFADIDLPFVTNLTGDEVFGGISAGVQGSVPFRPILTAQTRLADLRDGHGISVGSFVVSDGSSVSTIDISSADTVGDIARLIESSPPAGRTITARISHGGLDLYIDAAGGGNLNVREVGGGTTAAELGILCPDGSLTDPIIGDDLLPRLRLTTPLANVLGSRADVQLTSAGSNNDLIFEMNTRGAQYNDIHVQLVDDDLLQAGPGLTQGNETVLYSETPVAARASLALPGTDNDLLLTAAAAGAAGNNVAIVLTASDLGGDTANVSFAEVGGVPTLTIEIDDDQTTLQTLVDAVNGDGTFTAAPDASAGEAYNGAALVTGVGPAGIATDTGNSGGDAGTVFLFVEAGRSTANDVISAVENDPLVSQLLTARLDEKDVTSPASAGNGIVEISAPQATAGGSGVELDQQSGLQIVNGGETHVIDISAAVTVEDLLNSLNGSDANLSAEINADATAINVRSRLSGADLRIGENGGTTATDLGIRSFTRSTLLAGLNHGRGVGTAEGTDLTIVRDDGTELAVDISAAYTIGDVIDLINNHPDNAAGVQVTAELATVGNGIQLVNEQPLASGGLVLRREFGSAAAWDLGLLSQDESESAAAEVLVGTDVNSQETKGVFNSLMRLHRAVLADDYGEVERAVNMLDVDLEQLSLIRAELGARGQSVDLSERRLEDEVVELQSVLSLEIDADLIEVVPRLTALQTTLQASLQTIAQTYQTSLLDFV